MHIFIIGTAIVKPLNVISAAGTTDSQRLVAYKSICDLTCNGNIYGYAYCNYRDCSWAGGTYVYMYVYVIHVYIYVFMNIYVY
jgi:hypothetical protein